MNIYAHPLLACLWFVLIAAELFLWLNFPLRRNPLLFTFFWYSMIVVVRSIGLFYFSAKQNPPEYYDLFWSGQWVKHALVGLMLVLYAVRCVKSQVRIPRAFQGAASLVAITLMGTVTLLRVHEQNPDGTAVLSIEQYVTLWLCGLLWLCYLCNSLVCRHDFAHALMEGFVVLYSVTLVTSACRVYYPVTFVELWMIDMFAQLGVTLWWTWKVREFSPKERV